jgi:hypothetical protein
MAQSPSPSTKTTTMNNACMQIALMKTFNQEHRHAKNAKGKKSHGRHCAFVWHAAMLVVGCCDSSVGLHGKKH